MKVDLLESDSLFDELKPEWNDLVERSSSDKLFNTWEWQSTWWDVYRPGELFVLIARDDTDRLIGIASMFVDPEGTLRGIGCEDVTDYYDWVIDRDCTKGVIDCFTHWLDEYRKKYFNINICNIPAESPTLEYLTEALKEHGFSPKIERAEVVPQFDVPADWDGYLSMLDKKQRHELRRKLRRANGAGKEIDWYIVGESHDLNTELDRFLGLMASSDPEKAEFLKDSKNVEFFRRIVPLTFEKGWLMLNFLTIGGEAASTYFNFVYKGQMLVYNSGQDHSEYGHLSPGILLLADNIRYAIEKSYKVFNFLRGNEQYKYHMGGQDTEVMRIVA